MNISSRHNKQTTIFRTFFFFDRIRVRKTYVVNILKHHIPNIITHISNICSDIFLYLGFLRTYATKYFPY